MFRDTLDGVHGPRHAELDDHGCHSALWLDGNEDAREHPRHDVPIDAQGVPRDSVDDAEDGAAEEHGVRERHVTHVGRAAGFARGAQ